MHLAQELSLRRYLLSQGVPTYDLVREETEISDAEIEAFCPIFEHDQDCGPAAFSCAGCGIKAYRRDLQGKFMISRLIVRDMRNRRI